MSTAPASAMTPASADVPDFRDRRALLRVLLLVGFGFFVQTLTTGGLAALPMASLLKKHLHLQATAVAGFGAIAGIAWYLKPLAGAFVDTVRIRGTRYRYYLLIASAGAAVGWSLMGLVPRTYGSLLVTFIGTNVMLMLISTVLGGYMVAESRAFKATGRMVSFRSMAMGFAGFIASPVTGYLATRAFGLTTGINAALLVLLFFSVLTTVREAPAPPAAQGDVAGFWGTLRAEVQPLLRAKTFWAALGMIFLFVITPGFGTILYFYQKDTLHFSDQFIGNLGLVGGVTGAVGTWAYIVLCRRLSLRTLLYWGTILGAVTTALFVLYRSPISALWIVAVSGLLGTIGGIAIFDLAARASPVHSASLSYSLLMAVNNLGAELSNVGGSWLHDRFHVSLFTLIWINAGTTLLALIAIPFLPRELVDTSDGEGGEAPLPPRMGDSGETDE